MARKPDTSLSGFSALGLDEMTQPKVVNWDLMPMKRNLWWFPFDRDSYDAMLSALRVNFPSSVGGFFKDITTLSKAALKRMFTAW